MPIRDIDVNKLEECEDLPEAPRKKRSKILSVIGIVLLLADIAGMAFIQFRFGGLKERPDSIRIAKALLECGCIASAVLFFVALKFNRKNVPFFILMGLWIVYLLWFAIAMSTGIFFV